MFPCQAQLIGLGSRLLQERPQLVLSLSHRAPGRFMVDAHPLAAHALDDAVALQQRVSFRHRHLVDLQILSDLPHGRQQVSFNEPAAGDERTDLIHQLPIDRHAGGWTYLEVEGCRLHMCITTIMQ